MHAFALLLLLATTACTAPRVLGDGAFTGHLPNEWQVATPLDQGMMLHVVDGREPVPARIVVRDVEPESGWTGDETWHLIGGYPEGPAVVNTPDGLYVVERDVVVYRKQFDAHRAYQADVDARLDASKVRRFLESLEPAK